MPQIGSHGNEPTMSRSFRSTRTKSHQNDDDTQRTLCYFVAMRRAVAIVETGAAGEIENVSHAFQPDGRFSAANSP